ncbi:MAG: sugar phosphate isomerase/epimerase [Saprospiraceae bacterium]|nr:sugar phosphate isomerase/epimerase [Saprospiraceae bacterium]
MDHKINDRIVCAYLYAISKYGYPPNAADTIAHINEMRMLGFSSIELEGIREKHLLEVYGLKNQIAQKLSDEGLHVPYFCAVLPALSAMDEQVTQQQLSLFEKACEVAHSMGSLGILDNAPLPPFQFPQDIPVVRHYDEEVLNAAYLPKDISWEKYWDKIVDTYRTACEIAKKYGLNYVMHPAVGVLSSSTDGFLYFFDAVKMDNLKFNLDTANQFVMKENLSLSLRRLKGHVDYIHISDNGGSKVEHLPIGEGNIRWDVFFETLDIIDFQGHIGIDIGGSESGVNQLDEAYVHAADFISQHWKR